MSLCQRLYGECAELLSSLMSFKFAVAIGVMPVLTKDQIDEELRAKKGQVVSLGEQVKSFSCGLYTGCCNSNSHFLSLLTLVSDVGKGKKADRPEE